VDNVKAALDRLDRAAISGMDAEFVDDYNTIRAHIEGLEAREAALSEQVCTVTGWCEAANKRAEAAEARVRELEADAARYRFLRNDPPSSLCVRIDREGCQAIYTDGELLDAAIDAARRE